MLLRRLLPGEKSALEEEECPTWASPRGIATITHGSSGGMKSEPPLPLVHSFEKPEVQREGEKKNKAGIKGEICLHESLLFFFFLNLKLAS